MIPLLAVTVGTGGLIPLLIGLLVLAIIAYCIFLVVGMLPLPSPIKQLAVIIISLILLLVLLSKLGYAI